MPKARFNHTDDVITENDMNSKFASASADFKAALPRGFYLIIHVIILAALGLTLYSHWGHDAAMHGRADVVLVGLVAVQVLLYLVFFRPAHAHPLAGLALVSEAFAEAPLTTHMVGVHRRERGHRARGVPH